MSSAYYFASRGHGNNTEFDAIPEGTKIMEFYSRPVGPVEGYEDIYEIGDPDADNDGSSYMKEQKVAPQIPGSDPPIGSLILPRKVPMKVDPKAMFAVERTFMQWMHSSLWLLGASLTIISYSNNDPIKLLYGALLTPVALSFTFYSLFQFRKRVIMLRVKHPGPYEDTKGPTILAIMLMTSIIAQFITHVFYWF